jgi:hypothetical protein
MDGGKHESTNILRVYVLMIIEAMDNMMRKKLLSSDEVIPA